MSNPYITIMNSIEYATNPKTGHRFHVIATGPLYELNKSSQANRTIGGKLDLQRGNIYKVMNLTIRCEESNSSGDGFGTKDDLEAYFLLNDPQPATGYPTDLIWLTDNYGTTYSGFLLGKALPEPLSTIIVGAEAHYNFQISFEIKDKIA